ncbi:MAG: Rrf2 family transcriptional regulator [Acidobacteriia bacterium]|nr:Rrf2 family transcriptional regulator [Terriglobia bacterium]
MIFSRPCEYAIRAMTHLADSPEGVARAQEIAEAEDIPLPILSKVLQDLARDGLLKSRRGPGGGFRLARGPEHISLRDVVAAIDGTEDFYRCVAGLAGCSEEAPCPLHDMWKHFRENLMVSLETSTLDSMAKVVKKKKQVAAKKGPRLSGVV